MKFEMHKKGFTTTWWHACMILWSSSLVGFSRASIRSGSIECDPNVVGVRGATLIVTLDSSVTIPVDSLLEVTVPSGSSIKPGEIKCGIAGYIDNDGLNCKGIDDFTVQFTVINELPRYQQNVFQFHDAFNAPLTSETSQSFRVEVYNQDRSDLLFSETSGITLSGLEPNLLSASIKQTDNSARKVGQETQIEFSIEATNPIPQGGGVKIEMPKWNTEAPAPISYVTNNDEATLCESTDGRPAARCAFFGSTSTDTIFVRDMFSNGEQGARQRFRFVMNFVLNPLSMSPVQFVVTTFDSDDDQQYTYDIDQGLADFQPTEPASIDPADCIIQADESTVSEQTQLIIPFKLPVPVMLDLGCTILITLPNDFEVVSGKLTIFRGWGMFQGVQELNAQVNEQQGTIKIEDQCQKYFPAEQQNTIRIGQITNPALVRPTQDFRIEVLDNSSQLIAAVDPGVTFQPTPGTVSNIALIPQTARVVIQEITDVELVFTPKHYISTQGQIRVIMPDDLPTQNCDISETSGGIEQQNINCNIDNGVLFINDPFKNEAFLGDSQLSITFRSLQMPNSERPILGITIETYDKPDGGGDHYLVDRFQSLDYQFFTPASVTFLSSKITPSTKYTYTESKFVFENTVATQIPVGSYVKIKVPKQVLIQNTLLAIGTCAKSQSGIPTPQDQEMVCEIVADLDENQQPDGTHTITITDSVDQMLERDQKMIFEIGQGIVTPISSETTDSFEIVVYDANGYVINFVRQALTITMRDGKRIENVEIVPTSYTVGEQADYTIAFISPVPIEDHFKLQIFVPTDVQPPRAQDIRCEGQEPLVADLGCYLNGNRITMELDMRNSGDIVTIDTTLYIKIGTMTNPGSTYQTQPFGLSIRSKTWYEVAEELAPVGGQVEMKDPAEITEYSYSVFDERQKALTSVTITWVSQQIYPQDTKIVIDYNQLQIQPSITDFATEYVDCIFRQSRFIKCRFERDKIIIDDIMPSEAQKNSNMELTITNMKINVVTPLTTDSWQLTTYLSDGRSMIDQIPGGMTLTFDCNYPCEECRQGQPDVCTKCNDIQGDMILYESKCYLQCPPGTFFEYFQCKLCDSKCKTCEYLSGTSCTTCDGDSAYPYLNGKDCSPTCSYGEFGNALTNECEACEVPCAECVETPNKCTTCRQDNLDKYFLDFSCREKCPVGYYVQLEARNNVCLECSDNCLECDLTADTCTKCAEGWILNGLDSTCVQECPVGTTIFSPATIDKDATCDPCKTSCKTCETTVDFCTSCRDPLSLDRNEAKCILECDIFEQKSVSVQNVCYGCSSSCETCQFSPDYCLTCVQGTYFYRNSCKAKCPMINDYQFTPSKEDGVTCVIEGLRCPFGWKVDEWGTGCELVNQVCETNYELNWDKSACIPISTFWIPFPIVITMAVLCIVPIVSKIKFKKHTLIVPSFTIFVSFCESVCIVVLVAQSYKYGITPTFYLAIVSLIFLFAGNMFFSLMYFQQVRADSAFKHWYPRHTRIATFDSCMGIINFKMYRLLYCRMFAKAQLDAPFTEPKIFYRPFNLTSLFAIVTVTLPVIVSSIIALIYVRFGYQLYITAIEMLVIEVCLVILQVTEYCQQKFGNKQYFKVTKREVEVKVCSDFPDSDEYDAFETKKDKSKSKPKSIKAVRHLKSMVNIMANNEDFAQDQTKQVEREIMELHVDDMMNRQLRRCQSFQMFRPNLDEAFSGDEQSDDQIQDFISEPASPRSKEMLFNRNFCGRMLHYNQAVYKMKDEFDNCYHEAVDHTQKLLRPVDKKVQVNFLEIMGIDDARKNDDTDDDSEELVNNNKFSKRKRLSKKRIMQIPDFEYDEIQGDFEADETGKFMLVQKNGKLFDKKGRMVNRRGYMVDKDGNVITRLGKLVFYNHEISPDDDELPEPYCYEKIRGLRGPKSDLQFKITNYNTLFEDKEKKLAAERQIEEEMEEARRKKHAEKQASKQNRQDDEESSMSEIQAPPPMREEEEEFIQKLTQPKQPKTKGQFNNAQGKKGKKGLSSEQRNKANSRENLADDSGKFAFKAMRPPSQASHHRVEQLQEMIEMKDLQFSNGNTRMSRVSSGQQRTGGSKYVPGQEIRQVYAEHESKLNNQRQKVLLDQEFLGKIDNFNKQLSSRRQEFLNNSAAGAKFLGSDHVASDIASQMEARGLAHKNLSSVYGRVKQKFNQNIQKDSQGSVFGNKSAQPAGPSATVHKRVDDRMHELEGIYMKPRVDGQKVKHQMPRNQDNMQSAIESLDVTRQLREIHHLKSGQSNGGAGK